MERKNDEQMIYLKDLLFAALRSWRIVLIVAVALAVLLGGYRGISKSSAGTDPAVLEEAQEQYEAEKAILEQRVETLKESLVSRQAYFENSILMQLDPYNHYEAVISLYADTGYKIQPGNSYQDPDKTNIVLGAYKAVLLGESCVQEIAQVLETESQYVAELLTVELDETTGAMNAWFKCATQEQATQVLDVMVRQLTGAYAQVEKAVVAHNPRLLDSTVRAYVDPKLAESQKTETARLNELLTNLADAEAKSAALAAPVAAKVSFGTVVKQAVIFAVLGFVAGAFITVCVIWVMHIAGKAAYSVRSVESRTGVKVIGCVAHTAITNKIDSWLNTLEGRCTADPAQQTALLATDIRCRIPEVKTLLVTGSESPEERENLVQALQKGMPNAKVLDPGSILTSPQALEALAGADAVVLVEKCHSASYGDISREKAIICDYNKQLVGCVLLDG